MGTYFNKTPGMPPILCASLCSFTFMLQGRDRLNFPWGRADSEYWINNMANAAPGLEISPHDLWNGLESLQWLGKPPDFKEEREKKGDWIKESWTTLLL